MKKDLSTENKIDAALESLSKVQRATPSPYFYSRLLSRLADNQQVNVWEKWSSFFLRPTIALATICFVLVINIFVIYSKYNTRFSLTDSPELATTEEYNQVSTSLYDLENVAP